MGNPVWVEAEEKQIKKSRATTIRIYNGSAYNRIHNSRTSSSNDHEEECHDGQSSPFDRNMRRLLSAARGLGAISDRRSPSNFNSSEQDLESDMEGIRRRERHSRENELDHIERRARRREQQVNNSTTNTRNNNSTSTSSIFDSDDEDSPHLNTRVFQERVRIRSRINTQASSSSTMNNNNNNSTTASPGSTLRNNSMVLSPYGPYIPSRIVDSRFSSFQQSSASPHPQSESFASVASTLNNNSQQPPEMHELALSAFHNLSRLYHDQREASESQLQQQEQNQTSQSSNLPPPSPVSLSASAADMLETAHAASRLFSQLYESWDTTNNNNLPSSQAISHRSHVPSSYPVEPARPDFGPSSSLR